MKKLLMLSCIMFVLTGCMKSNNVIELGNITEEGDVVVKKSIETEPKYNELMEIFNNGTNLKLSDEEVNRLPYQYIQFKDRTQNLIVVNYNMWLDEENERILYSDYVARVPLYYVIEDEEYNKLLDVFEKDKMQTFSDQYENFDQSN
ncbi:hypothetical protein ACQKM9_14345 [Viridibacillus sp. NPDC093762]|uniref:hypothetical protein n=1 Tax=Viridibacillus sp. NPDC093762 TaxID=3390720 RepID=UPI003CFEE2F4